MAMNILLNEHKVTEVKRDKTRANESWP